MLGLHWIDDIHKCRETFTNIPIKKASLWIQDAGDMGNCEDL